jgi:hypothetical protein
MAWAANQPIGFFILLLHRYGGGAMLGAMRSVPGLVLALAFAAVVLGLAAMLRDPEYDEGYTAFVTATAARPNWPQTAFRVADARAAFRPAPTPWAIDGNLRRTDVHPPLYFWTVWAWRRLWGPDLTVTRMLSVGFSLGALASVAAIAAEAGFPVVTSLLLTLGCYGFVETGIVARGFAMTQCLLLFGLLLALRTARMGGAWSFAAGLALGAACFTNYLAAFPAAAAVLWFGGQRPRHLAPLLLGLLPFILADASFFLDQRNSRIGQFPPFAWGPMGAAMAHALGGAVLGGLPLYLPAGAPRLGAGALLGVALVALLLLPVLRWQHLGPAAPRRLLAMATVATPVGLGFMGLCAHTVPVEIRYFAFALPPLALLLAASFASLPQPWPRRILASILIVQNAAIVGLMTRSETMQPEGSLAREAFRAAGDTGLVLLPRGNDGVGIVAAFITAAPDGLHILLVDPGCRLTRLRQALLAWPRVTAADIAVDRDSVRTVPLLADALQGDRQMR